MKPTTLLTTVALAQLAYSIPIPSPAPQGDVILSERQLDLDGILGSTSSASSSSNSTSAASTSSCVVLGGCTSGAAAACEQTANGDNTDSSGQTSSSLCGSSTNTTSSSSGGVLGLGGLVKRYAIRAWKGVRGGVGY